MCSRPGQSRAPQFFERITYNKKLKECAGSLKTFMDSATGLGPKLDPILFQLPPYLDLDLDRLRLFLALLERLRGKADPRTKPST